MMISAFAVDIFLDKFCKAVNAESVRLSSLFTPISGSVLAHKADSYESFNKLVLNEVNRCAFFNPRIAADFFKLRLKLLVFTFIGQSAFQIGNVRICAAKTELFIEHL